jgi:Tol biopolymer transport system component
MVNEPTPEGTRRVLLGLLACAATACTLTEDGYQPSRLVPAAKESAEADVAMAPAAVEGDGCARGPGEAGLGATGDGDCSAPLPLLEPALSTDGQEGESAAVEPVATPVDEVAAPSECEPGVAEFGEPQRLAGLEVAGALYGPALSPDGLSLYFSAIADAAGHLYVTTRQSRDSAVFSPALELASANSTTSEGTPFLAADGLYFFSTRAGGLGGRDLWFAPQSGEGEFATPVVLQGVNGPSDELLPSFSADGLTMLFASTRPGGVGGMDIYSATRASNSAPFSAVVNVTELNSLADEGRMALSSDGLRAIFSSSRPDSLGSWDLWEASRPDPGAAFSAPHNLAGLNSAASDVDVALSLDQAELFFASDRSGSSELWRSVRHGCP